MSARDCRWTRRILPLHLEGEASPADSLRAAAHRASCSSCRIDEARSRAAISAIRSLDPAAPPWDVAGGVLSALRAIRDAGTPRSLKWSALGLLAAILAVPGLRPWELSAVAWKFIVRIGELIDAGELLSRLARLIPELLSSPIPIVESLASGQPASGVASALQPGHPAFPALLLLAATLLTALFSGCALLGGVLLARQRRVPRDSSPIF